MSTDDTRERLLDLAKHLDEDLAAEITRLYLDHDAAGDQLDTQAATIRDQAKQLRAASVRAGLLSEQLATAQHRLTELCPPEIIKARRDAYMHGAGWFRVTSLGGNRYAAEHVPATEVHHRAD